MGSAGSAGPLRVRSRLGPASTATAPRTALEGSSKCQTQSSRLLSPSELRAARSSGRRFRRVPNRLGTRRVPTMEDRNRCPLGRTDRTFRQVGDRPRRSPQDAISEQQWDSAGINQRPSWWAAGSGARVWVDRTNTQCRAKSESDRLARQNTSAPAHGIEGEGHPEAANPAHRRTSETEDALRQIDASRLVGQQRPRRVSACSHRSQPLT
jgi:hypothetical protein